MAETASTFPLFDDREGMAAEGGSTRRLPPVAASDPADRSTAEKAPPPPSGAGPFLVHAWPLLALLWRLAAGAVAERPERLKEAAGEQIRAFEQAALSAGLDARQIAIARYTLCTAIDEAVVTTSWGIECGWAQRSLLSIFHGETWGGEKVFTFIERALAAPNRTDGLLQLFHMVLVLGFQGKFRLQRDGTASVDALRERLFEALRLYYGQRPAFPEAARQPVAGARRLLRYVPVWSVALLCVLLSAVVFTWFDYRLRSSADAVALQFDAVASPSTGAASP